MKNFKVYIDGQYFDEQDAKISVFDHGLLYGDGVFEGIRIYNGKVFMLEEHMDRFFDSAKAIMLEIPLSKEALSKVVVDTCRTNDLKEGYVRLVATRGFGDLGLNPLKCPKPSLICIAKTIQLYPEEIYTKGLKLNTSATRRMNPAALPPSIKSLNYLNNIMAKIEGNQCGAHESILLNDQGFVAECTADNIFVVKKGRIFTPPVYAGALAGLTRKCVVDIAKEVDMTVEEVNLTRYDLFVADEIFITGTAAELVPVAEVDGRIIGAGGAGPVTQALLKKFKHLTQTSGVPIFT